MAQHYWKLERKQGKTWQNTDKKEEKKSPVLSIRLVAKDWLPMILLLLQVIFPPNKSNKRKPRSSWSVGVKPSQHRNVQWRCSVERHLFQKLPPSLPPPQKTNPNKSRKGEPSSSSDAESNPTLNVPCAVEWEGEMRYWCERNRVVEVDTNRSIIAVSCRSLNKKLGPQVNSAHLLNSK